MASQFTGSLFASWRGDNLRERSSPPAPTNMWSGASRETATGAKYGCMERNKSSGAADRRLPRHRGVALAEAPSTPYTRAMTTTAGR